VKVLWMWSHIAISVSKPSAKTVAAGTSAQPKNKISAPKEGCHFVPRHTFGLQSKVDQLFTRVRHAVADERGFGMPTQNVTSGVAESVILSQSEMSTAAAGKTGWSESHTSSAIVNVADVSAALASCEGT
jgi:hypothetical protein